MTNESEKSRVLTLVFTDLADSTALKTERGDQAVRELIRRHRELVVRLTDDCAGRIIDWAGDGCFLTFETSSAAVLFALRLQQAHAEEPDLPCVRVGLHMGEVSESPGPDDAKPRIEGLAVDLAARVSGLAKPGQVLMSAAVYDSARQRLGVDAFGQPVLWQTHGAYTLKGFDKPLEIGEAGFEGLSPLCAPEGTEKARPSTDRAEASSDRRGFISRGPARAWLLMAGILIAIVAALAYVSALDVLAPTREPVPPGMPAAIGPITSIAVLPMVSLSDDPQQQYLADAITDSITSELAKIKALKVISNTSAIRYKNTDLSMREIAAELGVDGLLETSMLREGDEVSITAQLIHGPSDTHIWSENYTSTVTSILKLQSDIALAIADAIGAELTGDERRRIAAVHEVNPEAHDALVIGYHYLNDISKEGLFTAIEYFQEATEIDPEYAHAWGGMVCAYWAVAEAGLGRPHEIYPKALTAGVRALQLNDDMSTDQSHLGMISMGYDHDWEQAEKRFLHAVDLGPSDPVAHGDYAQFLGFVGREGEALQHAAVSLDLDPNPRVYVMHLALESIRLENNPERVRRNLERFLVDEPNYLRTLETLTLAHKYLGMPDAAIATAERWVDEAGRDASTLTNLALALADHDQGRRAREILEEVAAIEDYYDSTGVGYAYVSLDDLDAAFEWLERGYDSRDWGITRLRTMPYWKIYLEDPSWIQFRNDARYRDLIARVGFPRLPPEHAGYADEQAWKAKKAAVETANAPIRKIAVLPFEDMGAATGEEWFADGMTETLVAQLAKIDGVRVISRTSAMR